MVQTLGDTTQSLLYPNLTLVNPVSPHPLPPLARMCGSLKRPTAKKTKERVFDLKVHLQIDPMYNH